MKVIFLDIDGVLNNKVNTEALMDSEYVHGQRTHYMLGSEGFDPISVRFIKKLIAETGAKVVVSSTWRLDFPHCTQCLAEVGIPTDDRTPCLDMQATRHAGRVTTVDRGTEIRTWMEGGSPITHYVIIDDDSDMLQEQQAHFVQTTFEHGFKKEHFDRALEILGG